MSVQQREYGCHFAWGWLKEHLKNKSLRYIRDRIESLDREIVYQEENQIAKKRDLPRLYTLKGFLTHRCGEFEGNDDLLEEGKVFLEKALSECNTDNLGYKYVIISNLKHIATANEEKLKYAKDLKDNRSSDNSCLLYTSPSPRDATLSRMPSSA